MEIRTQYSELNFKQFLKAHLSAVPENFVFVSFD